MNNIKSVLKKILPQFMINKLKVFLGKHPYVLRPKSLMYRGKYKEELERILKENAGAKGIIIYPPTIDWYMPLFQRPQQLAKAFAEKGYLFFYCTNNLRFDKVSGFERVDNNLYLTNQPYLVRGLRKVTLLISWPFNVFFTDKISHEKLIYDYIDDLEVFDASGKTKEEMIKDHESLVKDADIVLCTADKLLEDVKKLKPKRTILSPNAVDIDHFHNIQKVDLPDNEKKIFESKRPIIGYYGAIAEWFDYDLLEKAAKERPKYEFVIIGPLDYDKALMKNKHLFDIKNIHFLGQKKYEELPYYLSMFSVATIPFVVNNITAATSPVKLFEYMAGGKPIVTTAMAECKKYKSVLIAEKHNDFVKKIDEALLLSQNEEYKKTEKNEAEENSWLKRVEAITKNL